MMKKGGIFAVLFATLCLCALCVAGCAKSGGVRVVGVEMSQAELDLVIGERAQLVPLITPTNAADKGVTWTSEAPGIASVTQDGFVTGVSGGNAVIIVKTKDGGKSAQCNVFVREPPAVEYITLSKTETVIVNGQSETLTVNYFPANAGNKSVTWSVFSGSQYVEVNQNGQITAKTVGDAVVRAEWKGNRDVYFDCVVTVIPAEEALTVKSVSFIDENVVVYLGGTTGLEYSFEPYNAPDKSVRFDITAGAEFISIDSDGVVTGLDIGVATVKITSLANPDAFDNCSISVENERLITGMTVLTDGPVRFEMRGLADDEITLPLDVAIEPLNASNQALSYSSSDTSVATVNENGLITAVNGGVCEITVSTTDGSNISRKIAVNVEVIRLVSSISIAPERVDLQLGGSALAPEKLSQQLILDILPIIAADKSVEYIIVENGKPVLSSGVISVSETGLITALGAGTATVMARAKDGSGKQAQCPVTVTEYVSASGIAISPPETVSLKIGGVNAKTTANLSAAVFPSEASVKSVTWSSSDPSVAAVDQNGVVTALYHGTAVITASADGGNSVTDTVNVEISRGVTGITRINPNSLTLVENGATGRLYAVINPLSATNKTVSWSSEDSSVASVDEYGEVTPKKEGSVRITATTADGGRTAVCTVRVLAAGSEVVLPTGISLAETQSVPLNGTGTLTATVMPSGAAGGITWSSDDSSKVSVNGGIIEGRALTVTPVAVTATVSDGVNIYSAVCLVSVVPVFVSEINVTPKPVTLIVNGPDARRSVRLNAVVNVMATDKTLSFTVTDGGEFITVSADGLVALKDGVTASGVVRTAAVTVTAADAGGYSVVVGIGIESVTEVGGIEITDDGPVNLEIVGYVHGTKQLTVRVSPDGAFDSSVNWSSSDISIAHVDSDGLVTAVGVGTARITARANDGSGEYDEIDVVVSRRFPVGGITITNGDFRMHLGGLNPSVPVQLEVTVLPDNATDKSVEFESEIISGVSDGAGGYLPVIEISESGEVRALNPGSAAIKARAKDGSGAVSSAITVTVEQINLVKSIAVSNAAGNNNKVNLTINGANNTTEQLRAAVDADATNKAVEWTSSDPDVVTVLPSGLITARKSGSATITASATDGSGVSGSIEVGVTVISTGVTVSGGRTVSLVSGNPVLQSAVLSAAATGGAYVPTNVLVNFSFVNAGDSQYVTLDGATLTAVKNTPASGIIIKATAADGSGAYEEITVHVSTATGSISLSANKETLYTNDPSNNTAIISVTVNQGASKIVSWSFSGGEAGVHFTFNTATNEFRGLIDGTYTVTATALDDASKVAAKQIKVETKAEGITVTGEQLEGKTLTLMETRSSALAAAVTPANATNKIITWESADSSVATVDNKGMVNGVSIGRTTVTVYVNKGLIDQKFDAVTVEVTEFTGIPMTNPWTETAGGQVYSWEDDGEYKGLKTALTKNQPIELLDNIDASATQTTPFVGTLSGYSKKFEGNSFKISGLHIDGTKATNGLFKSLGGTNKNYENVAIIQNITLENPVITAGGGSQTAFFAGEMYSNRMMAYFKNVHIAGAELRATSANYMGGFVGHMWDRAEIIIDDSSFQGTIDGSGAGQNVGGAVGQIDNSAFLWSKNFVLNVTINNVASQRIGGFAGSMSGDRAQVEIEGLNATIVISGSGANTRQGGLFGEIAATPSSTDNNGAQQATLTNFGRTYNNNSRYKIEAVVDITITNTAFAGNNERGGIFGWIANNLPGNIVITGNVYGGNAERKFAGNTFTDTGGILDYSLLGWAASRP